MNLCCIKWIVNLESLEDLAGLGVDQTSYEAYQARLPQEDGVTTGRDRNKPGNDGVAKLLNVVSLDQASLLHQKVNMSNVVPLVHDHQGEPTSGRRDNSIHHDGVWGGAHLLFGGELTASSTIYEQACDQDYQSPGYHHSQICWLESSLAQFSVHFKNGHHLLVGQLLALWKLKLESADVIYSRLIFHELNL